MAVTQYAFFVDSNACSGCKACQVACQDAHDIRAGLHWRRVIEVQAGGWRQKDGLWSTDATAYYLSMACHHCRTPVCGQDCSTSAIWKRPDGIVVIDDSLCTQCRKCEHACPYGAIRWDTDANLPRKCTFCVEDLERGLAPACVTACPNRALDYGEREQLQQRYGGVSRVFPLADPSLCGPALVIRSHRSASAAAEREPEVANWEEI